jgi:hypothetical protein
MVEVTTMIAAATATTVVVNFYHHEGCNVEVDTNKCQVDTNKCVRVNRPKGSTNFFVCDNQTRICVKFSKI